jgi:cell division septal protein FtsQ
MALRCGVAEGLISDMFPYVKEVRVSYGLPNSISIEIDERNKSVVVPHGGDMLLIDEDGVVVDILKNDRATGLPTVKGLPFSGYKVGERIGVPPEGEQKLASLLSVVNALRQADRDSDDDDVFAWKLETIDVSDLKNIVLALRGGTIELHLGDGKDL